MSSIISLRTDYAHSQAAVNSRIPPRYIYRVNVSGVNLPPLMFDGRESGKEYVTLEGIIVPLEVLTFSCVSTWIE